MVGDIRNEDLGGLVGVHTQINPETDTKGANPAHSVTHLLFGVLFYGRHRSALRFGTE